MNVAIMVSCSRTRRDTRAQKDLMSPIRHHCETRGVVSITK